jgi:hypothetical protein
MGKEGNACSPQSHQTVARPTEFDRHVSDGVFGQTQVAVRVETSWERR